MIGISYELTVQTTSLYSPQADITPTIQQVYIHIPHMIELVIGNSQKSFYLTSASRIFNFVFKIISLFPSPKLKFIKYHHVQ